MQSAQPARSAEGMEPAQRMTSAQPLRNRRASPCDPRKPWSEQNATQMALSQWVDAGEGSAEVIEWQATALGQERRSGKDQDIDDGEAAKTKKGRQAPALLRVRGAVSARGRPGDG